MVHEALEKGIESTERKYSPTTMTVRKWVERYEADKKADLDERSCRFWKRHSSLKGLDRL